MSGEAAREPSQTDGRNDVENGKDCQETTKAGSVLKHAAKAVHDCGAWMCHGARCAAGIPCHVRPLCL